MSDAAAITGSGMFEKVLVANRGEVAMRIARACADLGVECVVALTQDEAAVLPAASQALLGGRGGRAYLDIAALIALARAQGCDAVHPGYGFLSESAAFARACAEAGLVFIGPRPDVLEQFGDKTAARSLAVACRVPVPEGSTGSVTLDEALAFMRALPAGSPVMIKAVSGGGGRGMRIVGTESELPAAWERCRSEAMAAFGQADVYVERCIARARHIEVQVIGDGTGAVTQLGERECSVQRRHQKVVEMAPSPSLPPSRRHAILSAAVRMAQHVRYNGLGTFEFLVDDVTGEFVFIEANPRLQVEHTVTEQVCGIDLVTTQLRLAAGQSLASLDLVQDLAPVPSGFAIQFRVNLETMLPDGSTQAEGGLLSLYEPPSGPGVRVDGFARTGVIATGGFDSLLAKVIVHVPRGNLASSLPVAMRALREFRVAGPATNLALLEAIAADATFAANRVHTRWLDDRLPVLLEAGARLARHEFLEPVSQSPPRAAAHAQDWLPDLAPGEQIVAAPMPGMLVSCLVEAGATVAAGQPLALIESMKMEHAVNAAAAGRVVRLCAGPGDTLRAGQPLLVLADAVDGEQITYAADEIDPDVIRPDLACMLERKALTMDDAREATVARRHAQGGRTVRENIADLCDEESFVEYGGFAVAAQSLRRSAEELRQISPADGVVTGVGTVNAGTFGSDHASCVVVAYDYSVFAGTQGTFGHDKQDRIFHLAAELERPLVLFAEGGGGRPGESDQDLRMVAGLYIPTFLRFGQLSGLIPLVGIVHGRCFAGNAALLGSCDVVIATRASNIGMGGPAMIEGGGLGIVRPEEIGPIGVQSANGVVDVVVDDEAGAVRAAKQYLAYFQGRHREWTCTDQRELRWRVPQNRLRAYDIHAVIQGIADEGSVMELRGAYAPGMVTVLVRIEGRPMGLIANNSRYLGGAIDAQGSDKAARFMQLCDAHSLPILSLCDTPGFMVGPAIEEQAMVRRCCRMFVTAANLTVPFMTVVLRKGYGLGSMAMAGGCFRAPMFAVSWPSGEFGGMGLEGAVRLGFRKELAAITDAAGRDAEFARRVQEMYERGQALHAAAQLEIDNVIDPADTRRWIVRNLASQRQMKSLNPRKRRSHVDTW